MTKDEFIAMCARIDPESGTAEDAKASLACVVIVARKMQREGVRPAFAFRPSVTDPDAVIEGVG